MLSGCTLLFLAFIRTTNHTANILAACRFEGISHLKNSTFSLFIYESVHTSSAYIGLLIGLLLLGLTTIILFLSSSITEHRTRKTFLIIWATGCASFIISNVTLMLLPNHSYFPKYLHMMTTNPDPNGLSDVLIDPYQLWHFTLPTLAALLLLPFKIFTAAHKKQAIILTLPLLIFPFILTYYPCYTCLCSGTPLHFSKYLNILTPFLILTPTITLLILARKARPSTN